MNCLATNMRLLSSSIFKNLAIQISQAGMVHMVSLLGYELNDLQFNPGRDKTSPKHKQALQTTQPPI